MQIKTSSKGYTVSWIREPRKVKKFVVREVLGKGKENGVTDLHRRLSRFDDRHFVSA
jgi:hypothetical protein